MVEEELEGGLDDQLIDEAILWKKERKRDGGNWERKREVGSDDEEEKRSG